MSDANGIEVGSRWRHFAGAVFAVTSLCRKDIHGDDCEIAAVDGGKPFRFRRSLLLGEYFTRIAPEPAPVAAAEPVQVGSRWMDKGGNGKHETVAYSSTAEDMVRLEGWLVSFSQKAFLSSFQPVPAVVSQQFHDAELLRSAKPSVPAPLQHDFSDRYCVWIVPSGSAAYGFTKRRVQLCKNCGVDDSCSDACEPDPSWRDRKAEQYAKHTRSWDGLNPQPAPPRFQAPELRASQQWCCDLVKSRR